MQTLTTTIKRRWLGQIIEGTKRIEYREIKPYWQERLRKYAVPFRLRLINGMGKNAPEVTVLVKRVDIGTMPNGHGTEQQHGSVYRLHIAKVLSKKHWRR